MFTYTVPFRIRVSRSSNVTNWFGDAGAKKADRAIEPVIRALVRPAPDASGSRIPPDVVASPMWMCAPEMLVMLVSAIDQLSTSLTKVKSATPVAVVVRGSGRSLAPFSVARNRSVTGPAGSSSSQAMAEPPMLSARRTYDAWRLMVLLLGVGWGGAGGGGWGEFGELLDDHASRHERVRKAVVVERSGLAEGERVRLARREEWGVPERRVRCRGVLIGTGRLAVDPRHRRSRLHARDRGMKPEPANRDECSG